MSILKNTCRMLLASLLLAAIPCFAGALDAPMSPVAVVAAHPERLSPAFWVGRASHPDRLMMSDQARRAQNARLLRSDPSMHDLAQFPATLAGTQVKTWIEQRSILPSGVLYDEHGLSIPDSQRSGWTDSLALERIPAEQATRYGLVVQRAPLRTFPTDTRVFNKLGDTDIDRFQETAEFPGTPVVIAHASGDGEWLFVISPRYAAWVRKRYIAEGARSLILGYATSSPARVITGSAVHTAYTPEQPALSQLKLDMGARFPLSHRAGSDEPVNGQHAYTSHVLQMPVRDSEGQLVLADTLLSRSADSAPDYLSMTPANLIRQSFKFLGERYGWGHDYDGRDCSGFTSEVYRSLGVELPRNTGDQARSPALNGHAFTAADTHEARLRAVMSLQIGDLIYIPGHVMMVIGHIDGQPYVIHDTAGVSYRDAGGIVKRIKLNEVSVTPFLPLLSDDGTPYVDRITDIVRMRRSP
jgi:cell wall-associated NlpC family hydrolase